MSVLRPAGRPAIGLMLNQEEGPGEPTPRWSDMTRVAAAAEAVGVDSLWLVDHFLWRVDPWGRDPQIGDRAPDGPDVDDQPGYGVREAWTTLAALAATASRVRLGTLVTCTRYRNPALLAKMADTVDEISGGRLVLGLGSGDYPREHRQFGYQTDRPVHHFEEALSIIVPLLRTGVVDFEGEAYSAHSTLRPRGPRLHGPPILIGSLGHGPRILRLVTQFADAWNGWIPDRSHASEVAALREAVDAACAAHGRDPATLARSVAVAVALEGPMADRPGTISGSVDAIAAELMAFGAEGIDEVQIRLFPTNPSSVDTLGRVIERLGR